MNGTIFGIDTLISMILLKQMCEKFVWCQMRCESFTWSHHNIIQFTYQKNEIDSKPRINGLCAFGFSNEQAYFCTRLLIVWCCWNIRVTWPDDFNYVKQNTTKKLLFNAPHELWFNVFLMINTATNRANGWFAWYIMRLNWKLLKLCTQLVNVYVFSA